jgi:nucleotide-binding universal stress UspA family protein
MFKKIVWATDGSAGADHAHGYARDLARTSGAELVVHAATLRSRALCSAA